MKLAASHKTILCFIGVITAVVLCMLPFWAVSNPIIYIYSHFTLPNSQELGLVQELKNLGYTIKLNDGKLPIKGSIALWFRKPDALKEITRSEADYNFIYNEEHYPFDWRGETNLPVVLTPYQDLYEHYVRSNVKSALFTLGVNPVDFFADTQPKKYPLVYYGDNNKSSPLADYLKNQDNVLFIGSFWDNSVKQLPLKDGTLREKSMHLTQSEIVAIYNMPSSKIVPLDVIEATASGAMVITNYNPELQHIYGDSIVFYHSIDEFKQLVNYYLSHPQVREQKSIKAQKITLENFTSRTTAERLHQMIMWLRH